MCEVPDEITIRSNYLRNKSLRKGKAKMKALASLLLLLVASPTALWAKPKVEVRVTVNEGLGKNLPQDSLSRNGSTMDAPLNSSQVFYLNVTVSSDNAEAVAKNNGQWCIKGDELLNSFEYKGMLEGNTLELEIPQKKGAPKKRSYAIFDHKWRKLKDI
jgi:hypothetical protein